ncbi:Stonin-2 [Galemys pyrenaicus]|uniref:Stonin-2 n=1 Tax=Galemys pyrenaicus TaxID=202257 RepID=A0A8J6A912_GALPY|nr:Stonin-2 [Galemys pyrenaicus]
MRRPAPKEKKTVPASERRKKGKILFLTSEERRKEASSSHPLKREEKPKDSVRDCALVLMTTLDRVIATHQSEWVSFNEEPLFPGPSEGGTEEHLPGLSSSSDQSESSCGDSHLADGGAQDLSPSEQDDASEKMGLISEAASPPGSPEQSPPDLASAISNWVQFEDDTPWSSTLPPPKETGRTSGKLEVFWVCAWQGRMLSLYRSALPALEDQRERVCVCVQVHEQAEISFGVIQQLVFVNIKNWKDQ